MHRSIRGEVGWVRVLGATISIPRPWLQDLGIKVQVYQNGLGLRKGAKSKLSHLSAQAALLCSSEGCRAMDHADAVDAHDARVEPGGQTQGPVDVLREDAGHQAVHAIVGAIDDLLLRLELVEDGDGAEDLVFVDGGVGGGVGKQGRLDEVALELLAVKL